MKGPYSSRLVLLLIIVPMLACSTLQSALATPTPEPTATSLPIPTITFTPRPTATPGPTATPRCVPSPQNADAMNAARTRIAALVPGANVFWYDDFTCPDLSYGWGQGNANPTFRVKVADGIVSLSAEPSGSVWDGLGRNDFNLGDEKGFLVLFRARKGTTANLFMHTGTWQTADFRRWGLSMDVPSQSFHWDGWQGRDWIGTGVNSAVARTDAWLYLLVKLGDRADFTLKLWEKDNPANDVEYDRTMDSSWEGRKWWSLFQVYQGTLDLDEYAELSFAQK